MQITISPVAGLPGQPETEIGVSGDTITVDGVAYDLSAVPEGGEATPEGSHPFVGTITRDGGEITCTIRAMYDGATAEPIQPTVPAHWILSLADGATELPIIRRQEAEA